MDSSAARAVTDPPDHHFFGYYEKSPWDGTGRYLLTHEVDFDDRLPEADDEATIQRLDTETGKVRDVASTRAWNFQQGSMVQWLPPDYDRIAFNDRDGDSFLTRVLDLESGAEETFPRPLYSTTPDGTLGFSLNFSRLRQTRPVVGYALAEHPPSQPPPAPADDGIVTLDFVSGDLSLLVSIEECAMLDPIPSMAGCTHWLNHLQVAPSGERLAFIHRWKPLHTDRGRQERLLVVEVPSGQLTILAGPEKVSHFDWRTDEELVAWTKEPDTGESFHRYEVSDGSIEPFAPETITVDGHLTFSPDGKWALTDTYPDADRKQHLQLYRVATGELVDLGGYDAPPVENSALRCDLHPRWNRDGTEVCFDSKHEGTRQLYVMDVSEHTA